MLSTPERCVFVVTVDRRVLSAEYLGHLRQGPPRISRPRRREPEPRRADSARQHPRFVDRASARIDHERAWARQETESRGLGSLDRTIVSSASSSGATRQRGRPSRWGLPRNPAAGRHRTGFLVATVATVPLSRSALALNGYPYLGGGRLHVARVVWGGLLTPLAFVLLLSFAGPVVRPAGAPLGGSGSGSSSARSASSSLPTTATSTSRWRRSPTSWSRWHWSPSRGTGGRRRTGPRRLPARSAMPYGCRGRVQPPDARTNSGAGRPGRSGCSARDCRGAGAAHGGRGGRRPAPRSARHGGALHRSQQPVRGAGPLGPSTTTRALAGANRVTIGRRFLAWAGGLDVPGWVVTRMLTSGLVSFGLLGRGACVDAPGPGGLLRVAPQIGAGLLAGEADLPVPAGRARRDGRVFRRPRGVGGRCRGAESVDGTVSCWRWSGGRAPLIRAHAVR